MKNHAQHSTDCLFAPYQGAFPFLSTFGECTSYCCLSPQSFLKLAAMPHFPGMAVALFVLALALVQASAQQLQCNPCSHGYGLVPVGTSKQYLFKLTNVGTKSLRIGSKSKTGVAFSFGHFPLPLTLKPGAITTLPVIFKPAASGRTTGTITLNSNGLDPTLVMNIAGSGVPDGKAVLGVAPSTLDFGSVKVGSSVKLPATLSALYAPLTISSAQSSSSEFSLRSPALPITIAAGQSVTATLKFTPNASGTATAKLIFYSNAWDSTKAEGLTGVGVAAAAHSTDLAWNPDKDPVIGYNVYRGGKTGGPYARINSVLDASTNYTDSNVSAGATYFYVVTAVNAQNQESGFSNEAKVVVPSP
jgi:Abnormal spindle-like microcephaly-assoc'd, ASPM-SPD-2-Hydin